MKLKTCACYIDAENSFGNGRNQWVNLLYRQISNISHILEDNQIVDHSDVVGASPVGAAPTTSSFST